MAVYSWGANSHGQLGLGYESELCMTPQRVARIPFNVNGIKSIVGGGGHTLLLDGVGQVFACGWNNRGQLGLDSTENRNEFKRTPPSFFDDVPVGKIACGWDSSAAITVDQKLYVWGSNSFQQLGVCKRGFGFMPRPLRIHLPKDEIPTEVSFGLRHFCVLTQSSAVYVFGRLKNANDRPNDAVRTVILHNDIDVIRIHSDIAIKNISCGQNHVLLSDGYRVLGIGDNKFGQANSFRFEEGINSMCCGWTHNGVLTKNHEVLLWGRNTYGQIGCSADDICRQPTKLRLSGNDSQSVKSLHLGSEHGLIVTTANKIITWGWNEHGNCGCGNTENLFNPSTVQLPSANAIIAGTGAGYCFVVCE